MMTPAHDRVAYQCRTCELATGYPSDARLCVFCGAEALRPLPGVLVPAGLDPLAPSYDHAAEARTVRVDDGLPEADPLVPIHRLSGRSVIRWAGIPCPRDCGDELRFFAYNYADGSYSLRPWVGTGHECELSMTIDEAYDAWDRACEAEEGPVVYFQMPGAIGGMDPDSVDDPTKIL